MPLKFTSFCLLLIMFCIKFAFSERFDDCGKRRFAMGSVIGGKEAVLGQFPWHAALMLKGKKTTKYFCGASVITPKHLLSAAHCFQLGKGSRITKPEYVKVLVGGVDLSDFRKGNWPGLDVVNITLHPDWALEHGNYDADVAILELQSRLTLSQNIRRVCLPETNQEVVNRPGTVVGYGLTENTTVSSQIPKFIELTTKQTLDCVLKERGYAGAVSGRMFCAGEAGTTACSGDSGSAFVEVSELGRFTIIGVVSSNIISQDRTCDPNMPSAYTGIPAFVDWIKDMVKSELPESIVQLDAIPSRCTEPLVRGSCDEEELKYYFDTNAKKCKRFFYSGCNGNMNRFESMQDCQNHCQSLQNYRRCQELANECRTMTCKYAIARSVDPEYGCEKCECDDPCAGYSCSEGTRCIAVHNSNDDEEEFVQECREISKPGVCPTSLTRILSKKLSTCGDDADCFGNRKCCRYESHNICSVPLFPFKIEEGSFEDLNQSGKEGASVTLRCRATGDPKPIIRWTHDGAKLEPETGRFVLSPTGDLEILNLNMADAGTYVCTASSGVGGKVTKEYSLAVHHVVRGEKISKELEHLGELRAIYTFLPFENTTIDTKTYEISSDRDESVTAIEALEIDTISYLPIEVVKVFPNLAQYEAWHCSVTEVSKKHFLNLRKLERVNLSFNKISSIDKESFVDVIALKKLYLNHNQLTSLHEDTFCKNRALELLYLNNNQLESLSWKLLQNLSGLKIISLHGNKLKTLHASFFVKNLKLETIWLQNNLIEHLSADTFRSLVKLKFVKLNGNKCIDKIYGQDARKKNYEEISKLSSDVARQCSQ